jgi:hypothetical protein
VSGATLGRAALVGLTAPIALLLIVQLATRADRTADEATAIRWDVRQMTVLLDRAPRQGLLLDGWASPIFGQGVWSTSPTPTLRVPTSPAAGDVELIVALAPAEPYGRPLLLRVGRTPVASWRPTTARIERIRLVVPRALRRRSYELVLQFDLSGGIAPKGEALVEPAPPIRVAGVTSRILRSGG